MFPLESTLLIGFIIVTAVGAYALILRRLRRKPLLPSSEISQPATENQKPKTGRTRKGRRKTSKAKSRKQRSACADRIQYLMTLPENATVPDECLECPDLVDCLNHARTKVQSKKAAGPTGGRKRSSRTRKTRRRPEKPKPAVAAAAH